MKYFKIILILFSLTLYCIASAQINTKPKIKHPNNLGDKYPTKAHKLVQPKEKMPDLIVSFIDLSNAKFMEGQLVGKVKFGVKNIGNAPVKSKDDDPKNGGYFIDLILSKDDIPPVGMAVYSKTCKEDVLLKGGRMSGKTIEAGQEVTFLKENLQIPLGCEKCKDGFSIRQFGIIADAGDKVVESNEKNNWKFEPIKIQCLPDLIVEDIRFANGFDGMAEGESMGAIKVTIKNIGNGPAAVPYFIDLFLSTDNTPPRGNPFVSRDNTFHEDILLSTGIFPGIVDENGNYISGRIQGGDIAAGESRTFLTEGCVAPTDFEHCSGGTAPLQFGVFIDANNKLPELRTDNNTAFRTMLMKCND